MSKFAGVSNFEKFPAADIPAPIRQVNPAMRFQALFRFQWNDYFFLVGDEVFGVACRLPPYPGWSNFKPNIISALNVLIESNFIKSINRVGLRYIDLIEGNGKSLEEQIKNIDFSISVGQNHVEREPFTLRMEIHENGLARAIQVAGPAIANSADGSTRSGIIIDIDNGMELTNISAPHCLVNLSEWLERIHADSKTLFFGCLKPEAIEAMEPTYDRDL